MSDEDIIDAESKDLEDPFGDIESWRPEGSSPMKKRHRIIVEIDAGMSDRCSWTFKEPIENMVQMKIGELLEEGTPVESEGIALDYITCKRSLGLFGWLGFLFSKLFSRTIYIPEEPDMAPKVAVDKENDDAGKTGTAANNLPTEGSICAPTEAGKGA